MNDLELAGRVTAVRNKPVRARVNGVYDLSGKTANVYHLTLDGSTNVKLPMSAQDVESFVVIVEAGSYTLTFSGGTIEWLTSGGTMPAAATTAGYVTVYTFISDEKKNRFLGLHGGTEV